MDARFDPNLLATFLATARAGSISGASRGLHLSQPAVTAQIRKLEDSVGAQLFTRSVSGVTLTDAGHRLYDRAKRIDALIAEAVQETRALETARGKLLLAASTTIAAYVVPPVLAAFTRSNPEVEVRLEVGNTDQVLRTVTKGNALLGLVEGHARAPSVRLERYIDDEIVLVGRAELRASVRTLSDLREHTILWREQGSGTRAVVERALRRVGARTDRLSRYVELGSTEAIKSGVIAGLGVGFISRWAIRDECSLGTLAVIQLPGFKVTRSFYWTLPSGALITPMAEFYRFAKQVRPRP